MGNHNKASLASLSCFSQNSKAYNFSSNENMTSHFKLFKIARRSFMNMVYIYIYSKVPSLTSCGCLGQIPSPLLNIHMKFQVNHVSQATTAHKGMQMQNVTAKNSKRFKLRTFDNTLTEIFSTNFLRNFYSSLLSVSVEPWRSAKNVRQQKQSGHLGVSSVLSSCNIAQGVAKEKMISF